jgi:hypothetical protein
MPFKLTGCNYAFKEKGYYPGVSNYIKNLPKIVKMMDIIFSLL